MKTSLNQTSAIARQEIPKKAQGLLSLVRQEPVGALAAGIVLLFITIGVIGPFVVPYGPYQYNAAEQLVGPSSKHFMGTDQFGRDVFSRVVKGSRISLLVATVPVALGVAAGSFIGLVSGYWSGSAPDNVLQRLIDTMMATPAIVLAIAIMAISGVGLRQVILAIAILQVPISARVIRAAAVSAKQNEFIEAARAIGASQWRILLRHILPNVGAPIIVLVSLEGASAILIEASLSFLGFGMPPHEPSWGGMLSSGARPYFESAPWLAIFPGLAISLTVIAINFLGDTIRDILDPRFRTGRRRVRWA